ncbi:MAG: sigma 54-interacting transcriptional regulator [Candidatus Rokuibacteriota bacterium]
MLRRSRPAILGLAATLITASAWSLGVMNLSALDWAVYDHWLGARDPGPANRALVVVERDPASEARFGTGAWDGAMLARVITSLGSAGAATIGVDVALGQAGAPTRGGAASAALLAEATALTGAVVYPIALEPAGERPGAGGGEAQGQTLKHTSWVAVTRLPLDLPEARPPGGPRFGLAQHARAIGHTLAPAEADGIVRKIPLFVRLGDQAVPAFGLTLAAAFLDAELGESAVERGALVLRPERDQLPLRRIPMDEHGQALVAFTGADLPRGATRVPFHELWAAVEAGNADVLRRLASDKLVLVLAEPTRPSGRTPLGAMSDVAIQAHLLDTLLNGIALHEAPPALTLLGTLVLATLTAWLWLARAWWVASIGTVALALGYVASLPLGLSAAGLVLPAWPPLTALVLASAGALALHHFSTAGRARQLKDENARVREVLARQEAAADALEEDLEAARTAAARSSSAERELGRAVETLRGQVAEARTQEEHTRGRLDALERELDGLRAAESPAAPAGAPEEEHLRRECERMGIVTRDPGVLAAFRDLTKAARSVLPVLVLGEPGTGKELFARATHRLSPRADRPFVAVNMAAIAPELFESELFGHVKGSFTGASADRKGYFEQADQGTLFLDEVGELRPEHQGKLLRVLQDRTFHRVGASRPSMVDVRVVAASNRDLERGVAEGWFREDLYFRLKGVVLELPPLRARPGDIALLAARLVAEAAAEAGRDGVALSQDAVLAMQAYDWPGNVRELQHCLRRAVTLAESRLIGREDLRLPPATGPVGRSAATPGLEAHTDAAVLACLRRHGFDMQATAGALGWDRSTVTQRLKGLGFRALVQSGGDRSRAALDLAGDPAHARIVEVKLREYHEHLLRVIQAFDSADAALSACRRRFKNLPERHFGSLESLVRQHFELRPPTAVV